MIYYLLTQKRLPEHFGWEIDITAHLDFELADDLGLTGDKAERIEHALGEVYAKNRQFRTQATQNGREIARLTGILFKNFVAFEPGDLDETLEKEVRFGSGTFDAMGGAHLAARFLNDWLGTEASDDFIDWDSFRPGGLFACNTLTCAPGVKLYPILCRMLAELEAHVGGLESILAVHQAFSMEELNSHEAVKVAGSQTELPALAHEHGFRAEVLSTGARIEGRSMAMESHLGGMEVSPRPEDLATSIFALEDNEFNASERLWPIDALSHTDRVTRYLDPFVWAEHELGLQEHPRPAGSDIP